jgi:hypothetical protein
MSEWDDWHDKEYRRLIDGPNTSDHALRIWRDYRNPQPPEPSIADLINSGDNTPPERHETWRSAHDPKTAEWLEAGRPEQPPVQAPVEPVELSERAERPGRWCLCGCGEEVKGRLNRRYVDRRHKERHKKRKQREV